MVNLVSAVFSVSESQSSIDVCAELSNVLPTGSSTTFPIEVIFLLTDGTARGGKCLEDDSNVQIVQLVKNRYT